MSGGFVRENPPAVLYRRFTKRSYAEQFASGIIRLGALTSYRRIEGSGRVDEREGASQIEALGRPVTLRTRSGGVLLFEGSMTTDIGVHLQEPERYFVCSFTMTQSPRLSERFGEWVVAIHDPGELFVQLATTADVQGLPLFWAPVEYLDQVSMNDYHSLNLWRIKRRAFAEEEEFRLAFWLPKAIQADSPLVTLNFEPKPGEFEIYKDGHGSNVSN